MKYPLVQTLVLALCAAAPAPADEGMWLFSSPPREKIMKAYGFDLTDGWLDHVQKASVRFNSGGSGSFVSSEGLLITNHHVGLDALQKLSNTSKNFVKDGFYAASPADEVKCLDLELNVLVSTEDVTARVNSAVPAGDDAEGAALARRKIFSEIETESKDRTGLRSDVITLYQGGAYHLYRYKRYTDVRLVFAPEQQAAFFGGDPDNFEYPRYDMDICIFRVYENGQPVHPEHFLKWSVTGAKDGDLVFVSGNPGHTDRLYTTAQLSLMRDVAVPFLLQVLKRRDVLLTAWSERSDENERRAKRVIFSVRNSRKLYDGLTAGLQDPALMFGKEEAETRLKAKILDQPDGAKALEAYRRIGTAQASISRVFVRLRLLESRLGFNSDLFAISRMLLRAGAERPKPNGERLPEYTDQKKDSFELDLLSGKPIYQDLETLTLADSLTDLTERLGFSDATVQAVLAGKSPRARAAELIRTTKVGDAAFRRRLYEGGASAVAAARDPMIELARSIDDESRALRRSYEAAEEDEQQAHSVIDKARFAVEGTSSYPDATFTLRLAYGSVKGYEEDGATVAPLTTIAGLYRRADEHHDHEPFDLPAKWEAARGKVRMDTPMNFVTTCDIIGGNSGSPTINTKGEFVGIVFDGDIESLSEDLAYDDVQSRSVSVHSAAILEALRSVYGVGPLADEIVNGRR